MQRTTDDGVGARVRRLRIEHSLTQRQLAEPRYTPAFVSTIEAGRRVPSAEALHYFAGRLGVSYDELATGRPEDASVELGLSLAEALRVLSAGEVTRAADMCVEIEDAAENLDLPAIKARARLLRARAALHDGDTGRAMELFSSAERTLADDPLPLRVPAIAGRARCLMLSGDLRYAVYVLETALSELRQAGLTDPTAMLILYSGLVPAYANLEEYVKAATVADEALALAPQVADPERVGSMHIAVAQAFMARRRIADAEASLNQAYEVFRQLDLRMEIGWCHWARGYVLVRQDDLDGAAAELAMARGILERVGSARDIAGVQTELAEVERRRGDLDAARTLLEAARQCLTGHPDTVALAEIHRQLGHVAHDQGRFDAAESDLRRAIELYEQSAVSRQVAFTRRLLGDLLREQQRMDEAAQAYRHGLAALVPAA